ncbi:MAG: hypothetical protein ACJAXS_001677 [Colwellia sp.]|jgi:hypothetical protein
MKFYAKYLAIFTSKVEHLINKIDIKSLLKKIYLAMECSCRQRLN